MTTPSRAGLGERAVVDALRRSGSATRAQLAGMTGLSRSAVATIVAGLVESGSLQAGDKGGTVAGRGRPAQLLRLAEPDGVLLGVDLGNSHVRVALATPTGTLIKDAEKLIDVAHSPTAALDAAAAMAAELMAEVKAGPDDVLSAVMGIPAPVSTRTGRIPLNNVLPNWVEIDAAFELGSRLGITVTVENDANLGALGEAIYGAAAGESVVLYVKVATGIGSGIVLDQRIFRGATGAAGEIGHVQVDQDGALCRCGARGCLETLVSLPRMLDALRPVVDQDLDLDSYQALLQRRHPGALRVTSDAGRQVGRVVADQCTLLNPSRTVVGGPIPEANVVLAASIRSVAERFAHPAAEEAMLVVPGVLGARAEVLGALAFARDLAANRLLPDAATVAGAPESRARSLGQSWSLVPD